GFAHSLFFAALLAVVIVLLGFRHGVTGMHALTLWLYLFLATASHGLLDAMTHGGLGVALFFALDNPPFFFLLTPIRVSPIGVGRFFSARGLAVLPSEFLWVWVPTMLLAVSIIVLRLHIFGRRIPLG